ncbi:MAG: VOC family protein [Psychromonas sp.]|nr:VOC family protein [Psychromonas sp.]
MLEIVCIDHIVLRTTKLKKMLSFYTDVLGCSIERETSPELGLTQLRAGSALIDLVTVDSELGAKGGGAPAKGENNLDHFCVQIKALPESEIIAYLASFNIDSGKFISRYGAQGRVRSIYINDPEGNTVEIRCHVDS